MNEKIIISQGAADSINWLKDNHVTLEVFKIMIFLKGKTNKVAPELKELFKLDNKDILKAMFEGYEIEKEELKELPSEFNFKYKSNPDSIFHASVIENSVVVSCSNQKKQIEDTHHTIENCIFYLNSNQWKMLDY